MKEESVNSQTTEEYLMSLQKEYICQGIREEIYMHENDKKYFRGLMLKKRDKINSVSGKYALLNIFQNPLEYRRIRAMIVPEFGFPNLIYNIVRVEDKHLKFAYRGTVVRSEFEGSFVIGFTEEVDFENNSVNIRLNDGNVVACPFEKTKRLNHQETDEFFYYYPGTFFEVKGKPGQFRLYHYDMQRKQAYLEGAEIEVVLRENLKRIS